MPIPESHTAPALSRLCGIFEALASCTLSQLYIRNKPYSEDHATRAIFGCYMINKSCWQWLLVNDFFGQVDGFGGMVGLSN